MVHSKTRNAPYIHPSHDSILELWRTFPNVALSVVNLRTLFGFTYIMWVEVGPVTSVTIHSHDSKVVVYCFILHYLVSFLVLQSSRWEERPDCFTFVAF